MPRHVLVLALLALLIGSTLPLPVASANHEPTAGEVVLFLHEGVPRALRAAPFEPHALARPGVWFGNVHVAAPALPDELLLAKNGTFRVHLPQRTSDPGVVTTKARVEAVGLLGEHILLAERTLVTPRGDVRTQNRSTSEIGANLTALPLGPVAASFYRSSEQLTNASASLPDAPGLAHTTLCPRVSLPCDATSADPGFGAFRPCRPPPPPNQNIFVHLTATAVRTADGAARNATGEGMCGESRADEANASWRTVSDKYNETRPPVVLPPFPHEVYAPHVMDVPEPSVDLTNDEWTTFTLALLPLPHLSQNETAVKLPSGYRLELTLDVRVDGEATRSGSVRFLYGRPEAPASLTVRTFTPGAFGLLSGGAPAPGGVYPGTLAPPAERDDYRVRIPAGHEARVHLVQGPATLRAWEADGAPTRIAAGQTHFRASNATRHVLVGVAYAGAGVDSDYVLVVDVREPLATPRAPAVVEGAPLTGVLGPEDKTANATFFAWKAQRFTLTLHFPEDASYQLRLAGERPARVWDVREERGAGTYSFSARADASGDILVDVVRDHGAGAYTLALDVDEGGSLANVPAFVALPFPQGVSITSLDATSTGVDIVGFDFTRPSSARVALHHRGDNWTTLGAVAAGGLQRDAIGRHVGHTEEGLVLDAFGPTPERLAGRSVGSFAFGGDGALYFRSADHGELVRLAADRTQTAVVFPRGGDFFATPDGAVYLTAFDRSTYRVDPLHTLVELAPAHLQGALAVDAEGAGYRIVNETLVQRAAPDGETRIVGLVPEGMVLGDLAASEGHLWVSMGALGTPGGALGQLPLAVPGFPGFAPVFEPGAPANLRVAEAQDVLLERIVSEQGVREEHVVRVIVENAGSAPAYGFDVVVARSSGPGGDSTRAKVPTLASGERVLVEHRWSTSTPLRLGDQRFEVHIDLEDRVVETDEADNGAVVDATAFVGGNGAACHVAVDGRTSQPQADHLCDRLLRV